MHTQESLLTDAAIIREETELLANTAERVGTMHQHTVEALFEQVIYTDAAPVGVGAGRITTGMSLVGRSVLSILVDLFKAPAKAATVSLTGGGLYEKGLPDGAEVPLSGTITPGNDTISARRLKRTTQGVTLTLSQPSGNSVGFLDSGLMADSSYVLEADIATGGTKSSGVVKATFVAPTFYGIAPSLTPTQAEVKALTRQIWASDERPITFNNDNQRVVLAEPKAHGRRTLIRNQNNYNVTDDFTYSEVEFTLANGSKELMSLYVLTDPAGDGTAFIYTFFKA